MGRNAGGVKGHLSVGDNNYQKDVTGVEDLVTIKDPEVYREIKSAIARYHSVMGVREQRVKLADLGEGELGAQINERGVSQGVYLNKQIHNLKRKDIESIVKGDYQSGFLTKTNKAIAHSVTHELAHATWGSDMTKPNYVAAHKEISKLFDTWKRDKTKRGYGEYSKSNIDEFWAETVTKAVHGKSDKYTRAVKSIAKRWDL